MPRVAFGGGLWCLVISTGWEQDRIRCSFFGTGFTIWLRIISGIAERSRKSSAGVFLSPPSTPPPQIDNNVFPFHWLMIDREDASVDSSEVPSFRKWARLDCLLGIGHWTGKSWGHQRGRNNGPHHLVYWQERVGPWVCGDRGKDTKQQCYNICWLLRGVGSVLLPYMGLGLFFSPHRDLVGGQHCRSPLLYPKPLGQTCFVI